VLGSGSARSRSIASPVTCASTARTASPRTSVSTPQMSIPEAAALLGLVAPGGAVHPGSSRSTRTGQRAVIGSGRGKIEIESVHRDQSGFTASARGLPRSLGSHASIHGVRDPKDECAACTP
jgi:hypothetical protein